VTLEDVLKLLLGQVGLLFALIFILWAGSRGLWVFGWYAKEQRDRITKLENRLDRAAGIADRGTFLATKATQLAEDHAESTSD
jgi:hypothetical protein